MWTWSGWARAQRIFCAWPKWKLACAGPFGGALKAGCPRARWNRFPGKFPRPTRDAIPRKFHADGIPWQFVDVIEVDPARRVKLRIARERLADMHPSELADILEDLAPAEREAVFTSLDE